MAKDFAFDHLRDLTQTQTRLPNHAPMLRGLCLALLDEATAKMSPGEVLSGETAGGPSGKDLFDLHNVAIETACATESEMSAAAETRPWIASGVLVCSAVVKPTASAANARQVNLVVFDGKTGKTLQALGLGCVTPAKSPPA